MVRESKLLGSATIKRAFSLTIIQKVREILQIQPADLIVFVLSKDDKIIIETGDVKTVFKKILGSKELTTTNSVILPDSIKNLLQVKIGDNIGFYREKDGKISIQ